MPHCISPFKNFVNFPSKTVPIKKYTTTFSTTSFKHTLILIDMIKPMIPFTILLLVLIMEIQLSSIAAQETCKVLNPLSSESGVTYFENMSQFNNFTFNLSILHSKDNKIPEAFNSIQKLLQQMR